MFRVFLLLGLGGILRYELSWSWTASLAAAMLGLFVAFCVQALVGRFRSAGGAPLEAGDYALGTSLLGLVCRDAGSSWPESVGVTLVAFAVALVYDFRRRPVHVPAPAAAVECGATFPGSDLPDMGGAVAAKMKAVADAMERGQTLDEAVKLYVEWRKSVLTAIGRLERDFIAALETTVSARGRREFQTQARSAEGYLLAAIESYKQRAYRPALDYCNGSIAHEPGSATALALRGLVAAASNRTRLRRGFERLASGCRPERRSKFLAEIRQSACAGKRSAFDSWQADRIASENGMLDIIFE